MSPRALIGLLCAVNLIAGLALGVALDRTVLNDHRGGRGRRGGGTDEMVKMLEKRLDLDADQSARVKDIITTSRRGMEAAMRETRPKMEALRAESDAAIRAILRPEQQTKFDDLRREWQERRDKDHRDHERERTGDRGAEPRESAGPASINSETSPGKDGAR